MARSRSPAFVFIFITVMLDMLSVGIIIPVLPKLVLSFLGGSYEQAAFMLGLFMSVWAIVQFFASPILGALSDRYGRRPVILMSNLGLGVDYLIMAMAPALWVLFVGRIFAGVFSATVSTAQAYIADITAPEKRAAAFGMLGAAFGLGFVMGPALGGLLGHHDLRLSFFAAALMSLANFCYGYFILPESLAPERRAPFRFKAANPFGAVQLLSRNVRLARLGIIGFLFQLSHHVLPACAVLYMGYRYQWDEAKVGGVLALVGVAAMIVQGGMVRPVVRWIGEKRALVFGLMMGALGFAIYAYAPTGAWFIAGIPVMALWGLAQPSASALMTREAGPEEQGRLQGANASLMGLAGLIGPWGFASSFAYAIHPEHGLDLPGLPFYIAAALMLVAVVTALGIGKSQPEEERDFTAK